MRLDVDGVVLEWPVVEGVSVLPRPAIEGGRIEVVDEAGPLAFREVEIAFAQEQGAIVRADNLAEATQVIVSAPSPAIPGMLLVPQRDTGTEARLASSALPMAADGGGAEE